MNISSFAEDADGELSVEYLPRSVPHRRLGWRHHGRGHATLRHRLREPDKPDAARERADSLRAERGILVRRRRQRTLDRLAERENITVGADGDWDFPNGTVLMKNFRLDNRLVETRLFMRHPTASGPATRTNGTRSEPMRSGCGRRAE